MRRSSTQNQAWHVPTTSLPSGLAKEMCLQGAPTGSPAASFANYAVRIVNTDTVQIKQRALALDPAASRLSGDLQPAAATRKLAANIMEPDAALPPEPAWLCSPAAAIPLHSGCLRGNGTGALTWCVANRAKGSQRTKRFGPGRSSASKLSNPDCRHLLGASTAKQSRGEDAY